MLPRMPNCGHVSRCLAFTDMIASTAFALAHTASCAPNPKLALVSPYTRWWAVLGLVMPSSQHTAAIQDAAALKARPVAASVVSWPATSSLIQMVLVSVFFIDSYATKSRLNRKGGATLPPPCLKAGV